MIPVREEYRKSYRRVLLVEDRSLWAARPQDLGPEDIVFTFDYGLVRDIRTAGFQAGVLDHVVEPTVMDRFHYDVYKFFSRWYLDEEGRDIFIHEEIPFGDCFRQEIWNEITYSSRVAICLLAVKGMRAGSFSCGLKEPIARSFAEQFGLAQDSWEAARPAGSIYCFPVFKYMDVMVRPRSVSYRVKMVLRRAHGLLMNAFQVLCGDGNKLAVYIQKYFPTAPVIDLADREDGLQVYLEVYSGGWLQKLFRPLLPVPQVWPRHREAAERLLSHWDCGHCAVMTVDGVNISDEIYRRIRERIAPRLAEYVATVETFVGYFSRRRLDLIVFIASLGMKTNILLALGRRKGVPCFLIINGFLSGDYFIEGRTADRVNAYGPAIKKNYFKDAANVVCLGDPRMDVYVERARHRVRPAHARPRIVIGAGGYDSVNLNGYLCQEFDFLEGVMEALKRCRDNKREFDITIKVRTNGYIEQYRSFCKEFYPGLPVEIVNSVPMIEVLGKADLYVSIYSQTHFEAAILGIPSVYYKRDDCEWNAPFDGRSELVTVRTVDSLYEYFERFFSGEPVGRELMKREVLEKYWGPLDGQNTRRNLDFILELARQQRTADKGQGACKTC